jgi:hypothetical protein
MGECNCATVSRRLFSVTTVTGLAERVVLLVPLNPGGVALGALNGRVAINRFLTGEHPEPGFLISKPFQRDGLRRRQPDAVLPAQLDRALRAAAP